MAQRIPALPRELKTVPDAGWRNPRAAEPNYNVGQPQLGAQEFVMSSFRMRPATIGRFPRVSCIAAIAAACLSLPACGQTQTNPVPAPGSTPHGPPPLFADNTPPDPSQIHMLKTMAKERNMMRQQEIVDDTTQLLDLAKELKAAVDKSSKDQLSLNVVNTAAEIEKLAKSVKDKMRDGQ
jgi:hypothetical protein